MSTSAKSLFLKNKALPNILVNFWKLSIPKQEESKLLNYMRSAIETLCGKDRYVVYKISDQELLIDSKTASACVLLIISDQQSSSNYNLIKSVDIPKVTVDYRLLYDGSNSNFNEDYFSNTIGSYLPNRNSFPVNNGNYEESDNRKYLIDSSNLCFNWSQLTKQNLIYYSGTTVVPDCASESIIFVDWNQYRNELQLVSFNPKDYFDNLQTKYCGKSILFTHITGSTMDLANEFRKVDGMVVYTNYQTCGIGRNNNQWLSPFGCALFTLNLNFSLKSPIMKHISFIQNLASLATILALPHKELNIKIKWPNDILFGDSRSKLAGILVRSYFSDSINIQIGIGVNVANSLPSVCLNDIITHYNSQLPENSDKIEHFSREKVVARILSSFENLLTMMFNGQFNEVKKLYLENWIHSDEIIKVHDNHIQRKVRVSGVDDYGYLVVSDIESGEVLFIQPDGNRFDMMHNMLIINNSK